MAAKKQGRGRSRTDVRYIAKTLGRKAEQRLEGAKETIFNAQTA